MEYFTSISANNNTENILLKFKAVAIPTTIFQYEESLQIPDLKNISLLSVIPNLTLLYRTHQHILFSSSTAFSLKYSFYSEAEKYLKGKHLTNINVPCFQFFIHLSYIHKTFNVVS